MAGLLLDSDGGVDDALALVLAASCRWPRLSAVTTVHGNVSEPRAAANLEGLLGLLGDRRTIVGRGAAAPIRRTPISAAFAHGDDGLGGHAEAVARFAGGARESPMPAADLLADHARGAGSIVAIGPLTNVAQAVLRRPSDMAGAGRIVAMGGAFDGGNVTPHAEFNILADPHAADSVLGSGIRVALVPLDLCRRVVLRLDVLEGLHGRFRSAASELLLNAHRHYAAFFERAHGVVRGCHPHDALAVAACAWPDLFEFRRARVSVDTRDGDRLGETVVAYGEDGAVDVAVDVDGTAFLAALLEGLESALATAAA